MKKTQKTSPQPLLTLEEEFKPRTINQNEYVKKIADPDNIITLCSGPAGSGKSFIAVAMACKALVNHEVDKILLTRPLVQCGNGLGYLPGGIHEKVAPYMYPLLDELEYFFGRYKVGLLMQQGIIECTPLEVIRGRNYHRTFMIGDEFQNATYEQIKMFLTRVGHQTKCVITGDVKQTDLKHCDLSVFFEKLQGVVDIAKLDHSDIQRSKIVGRILQALE